MEDRELIRTLTIPMYVRDFMKSEHMNPKYFEKGKNNKLPAQYRDNARLKADGVYEPNSKYGWREFPVIRKKIKCNVDFLVDLSTGERVIMNPEKVGKPSVQNINGQDFYSGKLFRGQKDKLLGTIKDQFRQFMAVIPKIDRFPLQIEVELYDTIVDNDFSKGQAWDVLNRWYPYAKCVEDVLKKGKDKKAAGLGIIPEDDRLFITKPPAVIFCPVETSNQRKLVINIYVDRRPIILNNPIYQKEHGSKLG